MAEDRITNALRGPLQIGDGTAQSGYVTPDLGPFECENCVHFQPPGQCDHPQVTSDPEVQGKVDPESCCNFFKSAHRQSQEQEHSEESTDHFEE
jgi:hypothetical protein